MLSINIERISVNSRLILTMAMIIIHRFFVDVQIHNISFNFICASSMPKWKRKEVLVVLRSVKFQLPIISLVNFCNYSLFFLNLRYTLDIKGI